MKGRFARLAILIMLVAALVAAAAPARGDTVAKSDNIRLIKNFPFINEGDISGDISYDGRYVYAIERGEHGGMHVYDPKKLKEVGFFKCRTWTDVKAIERGLVAFDTGPGCHGNDEWGVSLLDTTNPKRIRIVGFIEVLYHTFRNYPGKRVVYLSPNGCCGDFGLGDETILDVSDPSHPIPASTFRSYGLGCHDVWIHVSEESQIAACAAGSETQLWDVSDPLRPRGLSRIPTPQTFFNHSATISDDGQLLVVGDEAHVVTECVGGPSGDIWIYDISDPRDPVLKGSFSITRGTPVSSFWVDPGNEWCSAHNYEFVPGTRILVAGWYSGGMNVIDLTDPTNPDEIAYYMADESSVFGAHWIEGRIWTNDADRGVDVFAVDLR